MKSEPLKDKVEWWHNRLTKEINYDKSNAKVKEIKSAVEWSKERLICNLPITSEKEIKHWMNQAFPDLQPK